MHTLDANDLLQCPCRALALGPRLLAALVFVVCLLGAHEACASTFTVTTFTDSNAGTGGTGSGTTGDLRYAVLAANVAGGANTINFSCPSTPCTILLNGPLPPITSNMTVDGGEFGDIVLDGHSLYRVFFVDSGTVTLANLQIQNASATGGAGGNAAAPGGGSGHGAKHIFLQLQRDRRQRRQRQRLRSGRRWRRNGLCRRRGLGHHFHRLQFGWWGCDRSRRGRYWRQRRQWWFRRWRRWRLTKR